MSSEPVVLRNRAVQAMSWAAGLGFLVMGAALVAWPGPESGLGDQIAGGVLGAGSAAVFLWATRLRVVLGEDEVTVHKLIRTVRVRWRDVVDVTVDDGGLHIHQADGEVVTAMSMGTSPLLSWLGVDPAERRADQLRARAGRGH